MSPSTPSKAVAAPAAGNCSSPLEQTFSLRRYSLRTSSSQSGSSRVARAESTRPPGRTRVSRPSKGIKETVMEHDRFDGLTRSLDNAASRRSLGQALAGGAIGALFGSAFGALAVDAKQKRHKKKGKKRTSTSVTRTVRGPVTRTFTSTAPITIPATGTGAAIGSPANPYPSVIEVSGFANGVITDVDLLLIDVTHRYSEDIDML